MDLKIDVRQIIKDHKKSIVNANTNKPDGYDILIFLIFPIFIGILFVYLGFYLRDSIIEIIVGALSIFIGLLFNIIVILFSVVKSEKISKTKVVVAKELLANISFCIFISIVAIFFSLSTLLDWGMCVKYITHGITYILILNFTVTLLMILKRMYSLFVFEME